MSTLRSFLSSTSPLTGFIGRGVRAGLLLALLLSAGLTLPAFAQPPQPPPPPPPPTVSSGAWVQALVGADASLLPPARQSPAMAYDAATSTVVMFGGTDVNGNLLGDTWIWNGSGWAQASTAPYSPSPRTGAIMAYDAANGTVVLFGGNTDSGLVNETWAWNGSSWSQQDLTAAPTPRTYTSMAYDAQTSSIVLFGGASSIGVMNDTWTWNGSTWVQQAPVNSPSARAFASMDYFAPSASVVLFGGFDGTAVDGDTWIWSGSNWAQAAPAVNPPARYLSAMAYDANSGTIEMFGGISNTVVNDTWTWNGTSWTQQNLATAPPARVQHGMAYDAATGSLVLFGGQGQSGDSYARLNDTWNLSLGAMNVGTVAVGQSSTSIPVYFTITDAGYLGAPLAVTGGAQGLDFTVGAGSTCTGWVNNGQSCLVNVVFTPQYAGMRAGAVELTSSTGTVLATTLLQGTGSGAQLAYSPGLITTVAGNGVAGYTSAQDGGPATSASLYFPFGAVLDGAGNLYVADYINQRVRKIDAGTGVITTIAGTGYRGYNSAQDGGPASAAWLEDPLGVAVDGAGNLYIVEYGSERVRMISAATGVITTVAGNGFQGYTASQDGGLAISASFYGPWGVTVDGAGNLYIGDSYNLRVRKITLATGVITTVAGNGSGTYSASDDGGLATNAGLASPTGLTVDGAGNLYIAEYGSHHIRRVTAATGVITTVAGNGTSGYSASQDGGPATSASLSNPSGVAVDAAGNLYIADAGNEIVRKVNGATGLISTVAGNGATTYAVTQDGGISTNGSLNAPLCVTLDAAGSLYICDVFHERIRKVSGRGTMSFPTATAVGSMDGTDGTKTINMNNIGNLPLSISAISSSSTHFTFNPPSAGGCTTSVSIAPGDSCLLGAQFTPQSGSGVIVGTLNIAHNASPLTPLPAPILSGSTTSGTILYYVAPASVTYNKPAKLSVILSYSGTAVPTGALTVTVNGSSTGVGTPSCVLKGGHQNCTVPFTSYLGNGAYTISATKAGDTNYAASAGTGTLMSSGYVPVP